MNRINRLEVRVADTVYPTLAFWELTLEYQGGQFDPLDFSPISPKPDGIFRNKVILVASICDVLMVESLLEVDSKSWGNYKKPYSTFHQFCYKNLFKIDFFIFLIIICYSQILSVIG